MSRDYWIAVARFPAGHCLHPELWLGGGYDTEAAALAAAQDQIDMYPAWTPRPHTPSIGPALGPARRRSVGVSAPVPPECPPNHPGPLARKLRSQPCFPY